MICSFRHASWCSNDQKNEESLSLVTLRNKTIFLEPPRLPRRLHLTHQWLKLDFGSIPKLISGRSHGMNFISLNKHFSTKVALNSIIDVKPCNIWQTGICIKNYYGRGEWSETLVSVGWCHQYLRHTWNPLLRHWYGSTASQTLMCMWITWQSLLKYRLWFSRSGGKREEMAILTSSQMVKELLIYRLHLEMLVCASWEPFPRLIPGVEWTRMSTVYP